MAMHRDGHPVPSCFFNRIVFLEEGSILNVRTDADIRLCYNVCMQNDHMNL